MPESETNTGGWTLPQQVFLVAVFLALAYDVIEILSSLYLSPVVVSWLSSIMGSSSDQLAFLTPNFDAQTFYSDVIQNLIVFAVGVVIFLYVFYRMGTKLQTDPGSGYLSIIEYSFMGGLAGYILGYLVQVGISWAAQGGFIIGYPWYTYVLQLVISLVREAVFMAVFAFAGVYLGYLHSRRKSVEGTAAA